MEQKQLRNWLGLSLWEKLGPGALNKIRMAQHEPWNILEDPGLLDVIFSEKQHPGTPPVNKLLKQADDLLNLVEQKKFQIVPIFDSRYPEPLRQIHAPPPVLYVQGDHHLLKHPGIGVVGTRKPTAYGVEQTRTIARRLAEAEFVIISGMAIGIDAVAHEAALSVQGKTVAVIGCGLDNPYPKTNRHIRQQIEKRGCVVSEFPWGTPPNPAQFPRRNRIISGLSKGVLLTECTDKSGALITVKHAVDQNRDVFALPGPVTSRNSLGPISLLKQGAYPIVNADDIIDHYSIQQGLPFPPPSVPENELDIDPELRPLWDLLDVTPVSVDDLISALKWSAAEIQSALLKMELLGLITQLPGKCFIRAVSPVNPAE